jgi:hypothetical protein
VLAFADPKDSPVSHLLAVEKRVELAVDVNSFLTGTGRMEHGIPVHSQRRAASAGMPARSTMELVAGHVRMLHRMVRFCGNAHLQPAHTARATQLVKGAVPQSFLIDMRALMSST